MLKLSDLDDSQNTAITVLYENDHQLLIGPTGSGKSVSVLTTINELGCSGHLKRVLIIAPLMVCEKVWKKEHLKWEHLKSLKVGVATEGDRDSVFKRIDRFDIVVINFDQIMWLATNDMFKHFDGIVIDEVSKMSGGGAWFKSIRRFIKNFKWRIAMSATPISECWSQIFYIQFFVDCGKALGRNRDKHLREFFYPTDYKNRNWELKPGSGERIAKLVHQTLHVMPDYKASLPRLTIVNLPVVMGDTGMRVYREMAGTMRAGDVLAKSVADQMGKCQQIANGFVYTPTETIFVHDAKFEILFALLHKTRGEPTLIIYQHDEEKRRLEEQYAGMEFLDKDSGDLVDRWNAGKVPIMAMHIRTGAHGLNLQGGHKMVMLAPAWSRDQMSQVIDRLWRRGQKHPVDIVIMVAQGTIDELIIERLQVKSELLPAFLEHIASIKALGAPVSADQAVGVSRIPPKLLH